MEIKPRISLNSTSWMMKWLYDPFYSEHFSCYDLGDRDDVYDRVRGMSDAEYRFIIAMMAKKHWFKIKECLSDT